MEERPGRLDGTGSLAWAERTGGRLSRRERFEQARQAVAGQLATLLRRSRTGGGPPSIAVPERPPDSGVAREAENYAREVSSPALLGHCHRTYLWGSVLAGADGLEHDPELLYVASLLHDLGLTERHFCRRPGIECFAVEGAFAAREIAARAGWDSARQAALAEAITLHLDVRLPPAAPAEARLLAAGAGADVLGRRFGAIPRDAREEVLRRHPRHGLKAELRTAMAREASARPGGRTALLWRLGLGGRIAAAPFSD